MLSSLVHLGYGFARATLSHPWRRGRGLEAFLRTFAPEGLLPFRAPDRRIAARLEGCLACGLCEGSSDHGPLLHDLARSLWRAPVTWPSVVALLDVVPAQAVAAAESVCPAGIPFASLVEFLRRASGTGG